MPKRLLIDIGPLREFPAFRRLWWGSALSATGGTMTTFAIALQVWRLTHSSVAVGAIGLVGATPALVFGLFSGALIDSVDRRRLVLRTSSGLAAVSAMFAAQAFAGLDQLRLLYVLIVVQSTLATINGPARRTFLARLLPTEQVPAGAALNMLVFHGSNTAGPALAGILAAAFGLKVCYLIDALSFAAALYAVFRLPAMRPDGKAMAPGLSAVLDGVRFIRRTPELVGALLTDMNATVLAMPIALFPAVNAARFHGNPRTLGLLTAALAVGGIIGSTLSGPVAHITRQGRAMLVAGAVWGIALAGFGLAHSLWLTLAMLVVAGIADVTTVVFRTAMIQVATPDEFRGRVSAAEYVVGAECPQLGNFRAGVVASATSPGISAVAGGLTATAGTALIGLALPAFSRYRAQQRVPV